MNNEADICGQITRDFELNHEMINEKFYQAYVSVTRTSGTSDTIPVIVSEKLFDVRIHHLNERVHIKGQFRSFNDKRGEGFRLQLYLFAQEVEFVDDMVDDNTISLDGFICKQPSFRKTPFGREISDIILAVPRLCGKSDYLPCVAWGRNAHFAAGLNIGDQVHITGRIQSRSYVKMVNNTEDRRIAYEISVSEMGI